MKKIFFVMAALLGCIMVTNAQSTIVATLTHGSDISMFYGINALKEAHEKAVSGDIINLSSGTFQATDITKGITLRGTGIDSARPTYIINDYNIGIPADDANRFSMEGIRCSGTISMVGTFSDAIFTKSLIYGINIGPNSGEKVNNVMFANCKITNYYRIARGSAQFVNCYLTRCAGIEAGCSATFLNCIMNQEGNDISNICYSQLFNCIILDDNGNQYWRHRELEDNSIAYNCVAIKHTNVFRELTATSGCTTSTFAEIFKTFTGEYSDTETFELTDAGKKILGTDGTQVGIYGGILPYTSTPSYPLFTKMDVSGKTTADGKLSVDIAVGAGK